MDWISGYISAVSDLAALYVHHLRQGSWLQEYAPILAATFSALAALISASIAGFSIWEMRSARYLQHKPILDDHALQIMDGLMQDLSQIMEGLHTKRALEILKVPEVTADPDFMALEVWRDEILSHVDNIKEAGLECGINKSDKALLNLSDAIMSAKLSRIKSRRLHAEALYRTTGIRR